MKDEKQPDGGNSDNPAKSDASITRRKAIIGGMSGLVAGVLGAQRTAQSAQVQPLLALGGICEGRVVKLNAADSLAWVQNMLATNANLQTFHNYFTAQGMNFILSRAQVYVHTATTFHASPKTVPNIFGVLPSFVEVDRSAPSHTAVGLAINQRGNVSAGGVVVSHNPFAIQQFTTYDLMPGPPPVVVPHSITATELQAMSVNQAAAALGTPPVPSGFGTADSFNLGDADRSAVVAMTYKSILGDSYARPLYPASGFNSLISQTSLVSKFAEVNYQRMVDGLALTIGCCCCVVTTCCCNGCTTCSYIGSAASAA